MRTPVHIPTHQRARLDAAKRKVEGKQPKARRVFIVKDGKVVDVTARGKKKNYFPFL